MQSSIVIHRAKWVIPVAHPPVNDGGVAVRSGKIAAIGKFSEIVNTALNSDVVDHSDSVLLPALVNAHTHLELSHLAHLSLQPAPVSFTGWIENMFDEREKVGFSGINVEKAAAASLAQQQRDGIVAIGDISNTGLTRDLVSDYLGKLLCFKEYIGLRVSRLGPSLKALQAEPDHHFCTAHAPYSTHADLLKALKKRALKAGHVFPIHVAEPAAESEMVSLGRGEFPGFLKRRGFWDDSFQPTGIDNSGSVQYLHQLGILDDKTLCVHCVHVTDDEIDLLVKTGSKLCLCPGSNRYLGVGKAPVTKFLQKGILPALGTDSPASNPEISIWREMRLLAEDHPGIDSSDILAMATTGGAAALGLDSEVGTLEPGKQASFLAVELPDTVKSISDVYDHLVTSGRAIHPEWVHA